MMAAMAGAAMSAAATAAIGTGTKKDLPRLYNAWLPADKAQAVVKEEKNHGIMPGGRTMRCGVQIRKGR